MSLRVRGVRQYSDGVWACGHFSDRSVEFLTLSVACHQMKEVERRVSEMNCKLKLNINDSLLT